MPFNSSGLRSLGVNAVNPPDTWFTTVDPTENDYIMHDVGKFCYVTYATTPETWSLWYLASKANMIAHWIRIFPESVTDTSSFITDGAGVVIPTGGGAVNVFGSALIDTTATPPAPLNTITISIKPGVDGQIIGGVTGGAAAYRTLASPNIAFDYTNPALITMTAADTGGNLRSENVLPPNIIHPDATVDTAMNVWGGTHDLGVAQNITTKYLNAITLGVTLNPSIFQPASNDTATTGMYSLGGSNFVFAYGPTNTACGIDALSLGFAIGDATNNSAFGNNVLHSVQTSSQCTGVGANALAGLISGSYTIGIGSGAGSAYNGGQTGCIVIGSAGDALDNYLIRIGTMPTPPLDAFGVPTAPTNGEQSQVFIAGIWNCPALPVINTAVVIVDDKGQLYSSDVASKSVVMTDTDGNLVGTKGIVGSILTGHGLAGADAAPEFLTFKDDDPVTPTVTWTTDPITGQIILSAHIGGVSGVTQLTTDTGVAVHAAGNINVFGDGGLIGTDNTVPNTVTISLESALTGQVIAGVTGSDSIYKDLECPDGSLLFDYASDPTKIQVSVIGVPPVSGVNYLMDHALLHVTPTASGIQIEEGANITTVGDIPTSKITVSVTPSVDLPSGHLSAHDYVRTTNGDLEAIIGSLSIPQTDVAGFGGTIKVNGSRFMHNYGVAGASTNMFMGFQSGNLSLNPLTCFNNVCYGGSTGAGISAGAQANTYIGYGAAPANNGMQCTVVGEGALFQATNNSYMTCIGRHAGFAVSAGSSNGSCIYISSDGVSNESNVLRIGIQGVGANNIKKAFIAGIYNNVTVPTLPKMVVCGNDGMLSVTTVPIDTGAVDFYDNLGAHATVNGTRINILGADNINVTAAGHAVTVHLNKSVLQPNTSVTGSTGVYALGSTNYADDRFLHNYQGAGGAATDKSVFLGYRAGRLNAGATGWNNIGIGANVLDAYTSAVDNVAIGSQSMTVASSSHDVVSIGSNSGAALTTGYNSIFIGSSAGSANTTQFFDCLIGNAMGASSRTTALGYLTTYAIPAPTPHDPFPVETLVAHGTDDAYLYGVYNSVIDESAKQVYVDNLGKLGTSGGVMFSFYQATALTNVTGAGISYTFGTAALPDGGLVMNYDNTGSVTLGGTGVPALFTCPYSGIYQFTMSITYVIPAVVAPIKYSPSFLIVSDLSGINPRSRSFSTFIPAGIAGTLQYASEIVQATVFMNKNETVHWASRVSGGAQTIGINHFQVGPLGEVCWSTYFTGQKIG